MEKVLLSIKSVQSHDGRESPVEFYTEGFLDTEGQRLTLSYDETEVMGTPGATTIITVDGDDITLARENDGFYPFVFHPGKTFSGNYLTPWGYMRLNVFPIRAYHDRSDDGGVIELMYEIGFEDVRYFNRYTLSYKTIDDCGGKTLC